MTMRQYKWRTAPTGTEGTTTVYVDSYTGSDNFGDGKRNNPYATLTKALSVSGVSTVICRGTFSEDLPDCKTITINGDYLGAAVFDGQGIFCFYNNYSNKLIVKNVKVRIATETNSNYGFGPTSNNGDMYSGKVGDNNVIVDSPLLNGNIGSGTYGSNYDLEKTVFVRIKTNVNNRFNFRKGVEKCTFFDTPIEGIKRQTGYGGDGIGSNKNCLYVKFGNIANISRTYINCMYTSDCKWYYLTGNDTSSAYYELQVSGQTSEERQASLLAALEAKYDELGVAAASRVYPTFNGCCFSTETAADVFNDADNDDYTLKPTSDAVTKFATTTEGYCGALSPAMNLRIMQDSEGESGTWDEHTISGCLEISDDDKICIDTDSPSLSGQILSKVISVNPLEIQFNGVYANLSSRFGTYGVYVNKDSMFGENSYDSGDELPVGKYLMTDLCIYDDEAIAAKGIIEVTETGTTFSSDKPGCKALEILEPNVMEVVYCRCRNTVYATVGVNDTLQEGATYYNNSGVPVTYHNRTIANKESFVCMVDGEHFSCDDTTKRIAVMFDDTRVPSVEWCPAQLFGEYFVAKQNGSIVTDANGIPLSSGNYNSYPSTQLMKSVMDRMYVQFMIKVNKIG